MELAFWHVSVDVSARTKVNVSWITVRPLLNRSVRPGVIPSAGEELESEELKEVVI